MEREIVRAVLREFKIEFPDHEAQVDALAEIMKRRGGKPIYPKSGESLAVSTMRPKTAALAFDRVHRLPGHIDPRTIPEMSFWILVLMHVSLSEVGVEVPPLATEPGVDIAANEARNLRALCSELDTIIGATPTIFYENASRRHAEFPPGPNEILMTAIAGCSLVDEGALSWDQVLEFRRDAEARVKYRRLVRWIDNETRARSANEMQDLIAVRLDDYGWAMKKHGLNAVMGSLSCLLDPKFLGGVSATVAATAVAGGPAWAALAGTTLSVGRALLSFGTAYVDGMDERRKTNCEVAYLYEAGKLT